LNSEAKILGIDMTAQAKSVIFPYFIAFLIVPLMLPVALVFKDMVVGLPDLPQGTHYLRLELRPEQLPMPLIGAGLFFGIPAYVAFLLFGGPLLLLLYRLKWTGFVPFAVSGMICASLTFASVTFHALSISIDPWWSKVLGLMLWPGLAGAAEGVVARLIIFGHKTAPLLLSGPQKIRGVA
jgi:hypothetical protein